MRTSYKHLLFILLALFIIKQGNSQSASIELGNNNIALNQQFTITLTVTNEGVKTQSDFPNISGFSKGSVSTQNSMSFVNGKRTSSISLVQSYSPKKEGTFKLPAFTMTVNGKKVSSKGTTIKVGPKKYQQRRSPFDDPFFDRRSNTKQSSNYQDIENKAYLTVDVNKRNVYKGEGLLASIKFVATKNDITLLEFPRDINAQYQKMIKAIRVKSAWIEDVEKEITLNDWKNTAINGQQYYTLDLGDIIIFPQESGILKIPSLELNMVRYKVGTSKDFFGRNVQVKGDGYDKLYKSKPININVKALPPHPRRDQVPVGSYKLKEVLSDEEVEQNQSLVYEFKVIGQGNINFIPKPSIDEGTGLNFYKPNTKKYIKKDKGYMAGSKTYTYDVVANKAGKYALKDIIDLIYFDPKRAVYDTLKSNKTLVVSKAGFVADNQSSINEGPAANDVYVQLLSSNNSIWNNGGRDFLKIYVNIFIFLMFAAIGLILWRRKKEHG